MSVGGLCELCESGAVEDGCDRCGQLVCGDHYDESTGLCTSCRAELKDDSGDGTNKRQEEYPDGVDEYQF